MLFATRKHILESPPILMVGQMPLQRPVRDNKLNWQKIVLQGLVPICYSSSLPLLNFGKQKVLET